MSFVPWLIHRINPGYRCLRPGLSYNRHPALITSFLRRFHQDRLLVIRTRRGRAPGTERKRGREKGGDEDHALLRLMCLMEWWGRRQTAMVKKARSNVCRSMLKLLATSFTVSLLKSLFLKHVRLDGFQQVKKPARHFCSLFQFVFASGKIFQVEHYYFFFLPFQLGSSRRGPPGRFDATSWVTGARKRYPLWTENSCQFSIFAAAGYLVRIFIDISIFFVFCSRLKRVLNDELSAYSLRLEVRCLS